MQVEINFSCEVIQFIFISHMHDLGAIQNTLFAVVDVTEMLLRGFSLSLF